jgi:hypothetical protein
MLAAPPSTRLKRIHNSQIRHPILPRLWSLVKVRVVGFLGRLVDRSKEPGRVAGRSWIKARQSRILLGIVWFPGGVVTHPNGSWFFGLAR